MATMLHDSIGWSYDWHYLAWTRSEKTLSARLMSETSKTVDKSIVRVSSNFGFSCIL